MEKTKLAIIGSGPAGYSAAVYASRAELKPVLFAGFKSGGQLMYTTDIENYPGFEEGIAGPKLMMTMRQQASRFGTTIVDAHVTAVDFTNRPFKLWSNLPADVSPEVFEYGQPDELARVMDKIKQTEPSHQADAVVITTGATSIMLGLPNEHELLGKGVSTCAVCDAAFFREKTTFVVGGGDSAMEDALALVKFASSVTILHRRDQFKASKIMQDRVLNHPQIKVMWNSAVTAVSGTEKLESITVSTDGSEPQTLPADGLFMAIGHRPMNKIFAGQLEMDSHGYLITRQSQNQAGLTLAGQFLNSHGLITFPTMTSAEGVFAGGDNVDFRYRQAITAAGMGCAAALDAQWWLERSAAVEADD